jgi:membrane protein
MIKKILDFVNDGIWKISLESKSKTTRFLFRQLRILIVSVRGFNEDNLILRASALTFYTLLSIVPVIAMLFGVAKGFNLDNELRTKLLENADNNADVWMRVIEFSDSLLNNTKGGVVAGFGVVLLLWSVMRLMGNIEISFNDIWQINKGRGWIRKFTDYFSLILIAPILFIMSSSFTIYLKAQFTELSESFAILGFFGPVVNFLFQLTPYLLIWIAFSILYMIMPNTKVKISSAIIAGIIAGTGFQLFEWAYITFQVGMTRYNTIYGSFAALPLFLIWLQTSWLIVLMGAEVAFANQNIEHFEREQEANNLNFKRMKLINLYIVRLVLKSFNAGGPPQSISQISQSAQIPVRIAQRAIKQLLEANLLAEIAIDAKEEQTYLPQRNIAALRVDELFDSIESLGDDIDLAQHPELDALQQKIEANTNLTIAALLK